MNELASNADRMNLALASAYQSYINEIGAKTWTDGISSPLLMDVPEQYCRMNTKIMFVGQETHTWMESIASRHTVQTLQEAYKVFDLGKYVKYGRKDSHRQLNSQFWNFLRSCFYEFNKGDVSVNRKTSGFLWTNISKIDFNGGSPNKEHNEDNFAGFKLLKTEFEIVRPDIAILLVGRKYDHELDKSLPIQWEAVDGDGLLFVSSGTAYHVPILFKTMHPTYLCRIKKNREVMSRMRDIATRYFINEKNYSY